MQARTVEFSEPAFIAFLRLDPTPTTEDHRKIRELCDSVEDGTAEGTQVMFDYPERSFLVVSGEWGIVVEDRPPIWFATHVLRISK